MSNACEVKGCDGEPTTEWRLYEEPVWLVCDVHERWVGGCLSELVMLIVGTEGRKAER